MIAMQLSKNFLKMYTIRIAIHTEMDTEFQPTQGWTINQMYKWSAEMIFECADLATAQAKTDILRRQFWKVNKIGANPVKKYILSIRDMDLNIKMLSEFTGNGRALRMSSHS